LNDEIERKKNAKAFNQKTKKSRDRLKKKEGGGRDKKMVSLLLLFILTNEIEKKKKAKKFNQKKKKLNNGDTDIFKKIRKN